MLYFVYSAGSTAILSEPVELKQIADQTRGVPPRDLFIQFMSLVENLAVKVHNRESQSGQIEVAPSNPEYTR